MSMMWNEGKTNEEEFAERLSGGARPEGNLDNNDLSPMESISAAAIGGHSVDDLPPHYFRSPRFLVSLLVSYFVFGEEGRHLTNTVSQLVSLTGLGSHPPGFRHDFYQCWCPRRGVRYGIPIALEFW